jgi:hypothetical protein
MWMGLVRVSLPKRSHQPVIVALLRFPSSTTQSTRQRSPSVTGTMPACALSCCIGSLGSIRTESAVLRMSSALHSCEQRRIVYFQGSQVNKKVLLPRYITKHSGFTGAAVLGGAASIQYPHLKLPPRSVCLWQCCPRFGRISVRFLVIFQYCFRDVMIVCCHYSSLPG